MRGLPPSIRSGEEKPDQEEIRNVNTHFPNF